MKKICGIALAALLAACGTDSEGTGGSGGTGGGGGGGGGDNGPVAPITVENEAGRTFGGAEMTITIEESVGGDIPYVLVEFTTVEIMPDSGPTKGFYELELRPSGEMIVNGDLMSAALTIDPPEQPGLGRVQVGFTEGNGEFAANIDVIRLFLDAGEVTGEVQSNKPQVKASITGEYIMSCSYRESGAVVPDPDFASDFCRQFAHQLPAD